jgi:hypothetical protein
MSTPECHRVEQPVAVPVEKINFRAMLDLSLQAMRSIGSSDVTPRIFNPKTYLQFLKMRNQARSRLLRFFARRTSKTKELPDSLSACVISANTPYRRFWVLVTGSASTNAI